MVEQFKAYLMDEEKSELTVEKYLRDVGRFRAWLGNRALNKSLVLEYKGELVEQYVVVSVNSILSSINSYLSW